METDTRTNKSAPPQGSATRQAHPTTLKRAGSGETERPPSAQQLNTAATNEVVDLGEEVESQEDDWDPGEEIEEFDWNALHERYHTAINQASDEEGKLAEEWASLMDFFRVWAEAGHSQETDRSYSRFRTRMAYTQHAEGEFEKTRNHYTQVVQAFERAMSLLQDAGLRN
ncbi:hypothetical protein CC80DRAFT_421722 [Byssothecium circinans]|uniref:Uncharacterized protein n=1 Tax=Byssothecium circinans TaxID=147558 RepID=A0A6A5T972_9PLEO|nr:hypothetical protein CC80DRAFT_430693 [Byssothecium circinans]KAF1952814.1 hypothetical protein CC80DRAFT_421722 [Byssothecium circinans]